MARYYFVRIITGDGFSLLQEWHHLSWLALRRYLLHLWPEAFTTVVTLLGRCTSMAMTWSLGTVSNLAEYQPAKTINQESHFLVIQVTEEARQKEEYITCR